MTVSFNPCTVVCTSGSSGIFVDYTDLVFSAREIKLRGTSVILSIVSALGFLLHLRYMIAKLTGFISDVNEKSITLDVAGVGYEIFLSPGTLAGMLPSDMPLTVYTYHHVREQSVELFGFMTRDAKKFFELMISVSGVGPRSALSILDIAPLQSLVGSIMQGDASYLTSVSGIGKKTAEKIVIETRDKISKLGIEGDVRSVSDDSDTLAALQALGYTLMQAREVLREIPDDIITTNEKIKFALKKLN